MKSKLLYQIIVLWFFVVTVASAQEGKPMQRDENRPSNEASSTDDSIKISVRAWNMIDDYTFADTVRVDTIPTGFQVDNEMFKHSFSNTYTGNTGSPFVSNLISEKNYFYDYIFVSPIKLYLKGPESIQYFNTRTPYSNLTYINAGPSRRSEENFSAFFSQNINKYWNFGAEYHTLSTIGSYSSEQVDNRNFKLFSSYDGIKYGLNFAFMYNSATDYENGGLYENNDAYITDDDLHDEYGQAENIPVKYSTATNNVENFRFFFNHHLDIGTTKVKNKNFVSTDSVPDDYRNIRNKDNISDEYIDVPVSTVFHTLNIDSYKRSYDISDLDNYFDDDNNIPLYNNIYKDSTQTADSTRYTLIQNTFQIKFNEEFNTLLRFGLRGFISNEIKNYKFPLPISDYYEDDNGYTQPAYDNSDTTLVTTYLGGQIFKNLGDNLQWNAGGRLYFQGYRAGDFKLDGEINTQYRVFKDTAGVYAKANFSLRTPEMFEEHYYSNHFMWDNSFSKEENLNIEVGLRIPTRKLRLSWESVTISDYIYWNNEALPTQSSDVISAFQLSLYKDFKLGHFHSNNKVAYQYSSDQKVYPVPELALFTSNYFEFYLVKDVLFMQVGADLRWNSKFYAPAYMPATAQFYTQDIEKFGNYPYLDPFINIHLKRARIFIKYENLVPLISNNRNYLLTLGYPNQSSKLKFGISWNFYD